MLKNFLPLFAFLILLFPSWSHAQSEAAAEVLSFPTGNFANTTHPLVAYDIQNLCLNSASFSVNRPNSKMPPDSSKAKTNYVPMIVFGLSGMFLGAWAGHAIGVKEEIPGEIPEVFTKGTIIGAGIGLAMGATIGYLLGKPDREKAAIGKGKE